MTCASPAAIAFLIAHGSAVRALSHDEAPPRRVFVRFSALHLIESEPCIGRRRLALGFGHRQQARIRARRRGELEVRRRSKRYGRRRRRLWVRRLWGRSRRFGLAQAVSNICADPAAIALIIAHGPGVGFHSHKVAALRVLWLVRKKQEFIIVELVSSSSLTSTDGLCVAFTNTILIDLRTHLAVFSALGFVELVTLEVGRLPAVVFAQRHQARTLARRFRQGIVGLLRVSRRSIRGLLRRRYVQRGSRCRST